MISERFRWLRTTCRRLFRRRSEEAALDSEMQFHVEQLVAQFRREGLDEREAQLAARREFGATDVYREEVRDTWRPPALSELWRTVRFAARSLARTPGFTLIAVITLALGIGANTAVFSAMNAFALRPLPYGDNETLERIFRTTSQEPRGTISVPDYRDLQLAARDGYGDIAAWTNGEMSLSEAGEPAELVSATRVSANFFSLLATSPQVGRDFRAEEELYGNHRVLLISHRLWQHRFGGENVLGRIVRINGEPNEIIGVLPQPFSDMRFLGWVDLFRPLGLTREESTDRGTPRLEVVGRRASDLSSDAAAAFIAGFGERLAADFPELHGGSTWRTIPLKEVNIDATGRGILMMMVGLSGFVLLIACANLANFLLARTMTRAREFAVRSALGASRGQLLRPLLAEALLLALTGGVCAVALGQWAMDGLSAQAAANGTGYVDFTFNWGVLGWAIAASLATALAFGVAPALFALRLDLNATLKSGGRGATGGRGHRRLRHLLIVGQFALAMILLAGAALFARGLNDLNNRRAGWESDDLITGTLLPPVATYPGDADVLSLHRRTIDRIEALPGVTSVSLSHYLPFFRWYDPRKFSVEGRPPAARGQEPVALINGVSPDYFEAVGTDLRSGRIFNEHDTADAPPVYIINESMARILFPDGNPIGQRLVPLNEDGAIPGEIVGVAADVKSVFPDPEPVVFQLYQPLAQAPRHLVTLAVRTSGGVSTSTIDSIRRVMTDIDPVLPVRNLSSADAAIDLANRDWNSLRGILATFAVLGLGLAILGIYGVVARTMVQRTGEFGIRLALGARAADITRLVLASGVKLAGCGAAIGLVGAWGVSQLIAAGFPGMRVERPAVLAATAAALLAAALFACYLPARRAGRINPVDSLRAE